MGKNISEKPVTEGDLHATTDQVPESGLNEEANVDCQNHSQEQLQTLTKQMGEDGCILAPETGSGDALLLEKTRLELLRRKELALIEMQKIVAKSRKDKDQPISRNVKS